jgi:hypothetical protein
MWFAPAALIAVRDKGTCHTHKHTHGTIAGSEELGIENWDGN